MRLAYWAVVLAVILDITVVSILGGDGTPIPPEPTVVTELGGDGTPIPPLP